MDFKAWIGLRKSIAMYYWKPFNQMRLRRFYAQFIQPGDLCFDVGAHVGNRTKAWLALGARVVAVEPQPVFAAYLRQKFSPWPVTVVEQAISDGAGEATLHINSANPTISTLSDALWREQLSHDARYPIAWDKTHKVRTVTLDHLIEEYGIPAFCKLDLENYEAEALQGLTYPLRQISFEYYPPKKEGALRALERVSELGSYEYNWSLGETLRLNSPEWIDYQSIAHILKGYHTRYEYGDVYARLTRN